MGVCLSKPAVQAVADPPAAPHKGGGAAAAAVTAPAPAPAAAADDGSARGGGDAQPETPAWAGAPAPVCELERIRHLHSLGVMYTQPEARFDDITRLCTLVFKVPIALVSLVDTGCQWFKSTQGLGDVDRTPRNTSFCAWTLLPQHPEVLVVANALKDDRFKGNPLVVGAPHIRFYAGCPLVASNGLRLGSLCIIDREPREFDAASCQLLANMGEMVLRELEKEAVMVEAARRKSLEVQQRHLLRAIDCFTEPIMLVEVDAKQDATWAVLLANEAWEAAVGLPRPRDGDPLPFWQLFQLPPSRRAPGELASAYRSAIEGQQSFELLLLATGGTSGGAVLQAQFRCAANTQLANAPAIGIPNFLPGDGSNGAASATGGRCFYLATLRSSEPAPAAPPRSIDETQPNSAPLLQLDSGSERRRNSGGTPRPPPRRHASFNVVARDAGFPDIKLGPLLGRGAFGRVYRAMWGGRLVAVKIIEYTQVVGQPGPLEGLLSEQVNNPHVVTTYKHTTKCVENLYEDDDGSSVCGGAPWLHSGGSGSCRAPAGGALTTAPSMDDGFSISGSAVPKKQLMEAWLLLEFCNRGSVSDAVEKGWFRAPAAAAAADGSADASADGSDSGSSAAYVPNLRAVLATAREMAAALAYLHHKNILHGDLSGQNVLLTASPAEKRGFIAKVSDFGLSRLVTIDTPIIETRTYGTVTHMPPELLLSGHMSKAVDVYSFGVIVWEMTCGRRPFAGLSHSQVLHSISMGRALELPNGIPPGLRQLLAACLAADPNKRPAFVAVLGMVSDLEAQLSQ